MTRPALVIGLGGTGQWVLTYLKKDLMEIGGGKMPPGVKLLNFDTTSKPVAQTGRGGEEEEKEIRLGNIRLEPETEFIPIGENVLALAMQIADGQHPHLQWYPARTYLSKLPPAAFNTKDGSGQIRQMGRISVFRDVAQGGVSKILSHIRAAILEIQGEVSSNRQLEIIIVSSFAGGTGAGMLVDVALLARAQAQRLVQQNYIVRGFFILPRAFSKGGLGEDRPMLARAFATWRELDRFLIVSERYGAHEIVYDPQNTALHIRVQHRAYDVSYIVDTFRRDNSLADLPPEEGLYPTVADCISAILDDVAGQRYTEYITVNYGGRLQSLPREAYHSAVGAFTLKVPVYYAQAKFAYSLALEAMDYLLAPHVDRRTGYATGVSELMNREVPQGTAGQVAALQLMHSTGLSRDDQQIPNTLLPQLIAEIRERDAQRDKRIVSQIASGGLTTAGGRFLLALTDISQDEEGKLISRDITDELNLRLWRLVPPSRAVGDTPAAALTRIRNAIPRVISEHYGIDVATGERLRGEYGKALERAKEAQLARFAKLLHAWIAFTLNGESYDPTVARSGKIGYVRSVLQGVVEACDYFVGFLNLVRQERNENLRLETRVKEQARRAWNEYERLAGKQSWVTFWEEFIDPRAHRAQRNYLLAMQRVVDVRKDDILLDVLSETAIEMRQIAEQARDEIDSWITYLASGDHTRGLTSLYNFIKDSLSSVNGNHELDRRLERVSQVIGEYEYQTDPKHVAEVLGALRWGTEEKDGKLVVTLYAVYTDPSAEPVHIPFSREGDNPSAYNSDLLLKLAERPYSTLHRDRPLAREIRSVYDTGTKLADSVHKMAEPLFAPKPTGKAPEIAACIVRVNGQVDERSVAYFKEFEDRYKSLHAELTHFEMAGSEDRHKMTILRTNDIVTSDYFGMWEECRNAYIQLVSDPYKPMPAEELHIFPAEINACYYESKMPAVLQQPRRTLHPEVTVLLENRSKFELFFHALALGYIYRKDEGRGPVWVYRLSEGDRELYITAPQTGIGVGEGQADAEDYFLVINNFAVLGYDQRPGLERSLWVDWDKLSGAVIAERRQHPDDVANLYRRQIEDGIVKAMRDQVQERRNREREEALRQLIAVDLEDLADLAEYIYKVEIQRLEGRT